MYTHNIHSEQIFFHSLHPSNTNSSYDSSYHDSSFLFLSSSPRLRHMPRAPRLFFASSSSSVVVFPHLSRQLHCPRLLPRRHRHTLSALSRTALSICSLLPTSFLLLPTSFLLLLLLPLSSSLPAADVVPVPSLLPLAAHATRRRVARHPKRLATSGCSERSPRRDRVGVPHTRTRIARRPPHRRIRPPLVVDPLAHRARMGRRLRRLGTPQPLLPPSAGTREEGINK